MTVVSPPTSRPLARAADHLQAGRLAEAAGAYRAVLQIDPEEPLAHAGLGQCAYGRGRYGDAYDHWVRAAEIHRARGEAETALGYYGYAVGVSPEAMELHVDIADLEVSLGRREAARARLEGLAEAYLAQDREEDAVAILEFMQGWGLDDDAPVEAGVPEAPVIDREGTMICDTRLITPDGVAFVPMLAVADAPSVPVPALTSAADPEVEPELPSFSSSIDLTALQALLDAPSQELEQVLDDPDPTAVRRAPTAAIPGPTVDSVVAPAPAAAVAARASGSSTATITAPKPAPRSVDAQGRSLAERLRSARATPIAKPAVTSVRAAIASKSGTINAANKPAAASAPQPVTPAATRATSAAATKPVAATTRTTPRPAVAPSAAKPAVRPPVAAKPSAPAPRSAPVATRPATQASVASRPSAVAAKPIARPSVPPIASKPASARPAAAKPVPASRPVVTAARPAATKPAAIAKPVIATKPTTTAKPAASAASRPAVAAKPIASARPTASAKPTVSTKPSAGKTTPRPERNETTQHGAPIPTAPGRAAKPRSKPGTPEAVPPSATKPLVIPPPGHTGDFDDQGTVLYRRDQLPRF